VFNKQALKKYLRAKWRLMLCWMIIYWTRLDCIHTGCDCVLDTNTRTALS
jgi:hypothetical protein